MPKRRYERIILDEKAKEDVEEYLKTAYYLYVAFESFLSLVSLFAKTVDDKKLFYKSNGLKTTLTLEFKEIVKILKEQHGINCSLCQGCGKKIYG